MILLMLLLINFSNFFSNSLNNLNRCNDIEYIGPMGPTGPTGTSFSIPPIGNCYEKKIKVPLIGKQIIQTKILASNFASIKLSGLVNVNGNVKYKFYNDKTVVKFSNNLKKIIIRYKTEFSYPIYDINNDTITFYLNVKVINYKTKITMIKI